MKEESAVSMNADGMWGEKVQRDRGEHEVMDNEYPLTVLYIFLWKLTLSWTITYFH